MIKAAISIPSEQLHDFCLKWNVKELSLFGSVLREDFRPDSDIDVLVTFPPGHVNTLDSWLDMIDELSIIFGRNVDLVERRLIEQSKNWIRRKHILTHAEKIYEQR